MTHPDSSIEHLLDQGAQLLALARALASENQELRQQILEAQKREVSLQKRLSGARARVESLIARLPQGETASSQPFLLPGAR
jgi:predicted  nucleic acid-binding Zn-ribbon protein